MTADDVQAKLTEIRSIADDDEEAHAAQDQLYEDVLAAIAAGDCADPRILAAVALEVRGIEFGRWYA